jgi:hypothetical protein
VFGFSRTWAHEAAKTRETSGFVETKRAAWMLLSTGDKLHVITRRLFEGDLRRHFVGEVLAVSEVGVRIEGYVFVFDTVKNQFVKRLEKRIRLIGFLDCGHIVKVIPSEVKLDELEYRLSPEKHLVVTDGKGFSLDINEFGVGR